MSGKLIVIEGLDGSGKATQCALVRDMLVQEGISVQTLTFPDYDSESSALVRMYLSGEFGEHPDDVGCYAASAFYAVDRCACFLSGRAAQFEAGSLLLCDRYTTSNAVYQASKLPRGRWDEYINWLFDFEYEKLCIPRPDMVVYLDVPPEVSESLMSARYNGDEKKKDIHERDVSFQRRSREAALYCAHADGWRIVECADGSQMRPPREIAQRIYEIIKEVL